MSIFFNTPDIAKLIKDATHMPMVQQTNGNFRRIVNAGSDIGIDRTTKKATSIYTVITRADGTLVTSFPGLPTP